MGLKKGTAKPEKVVNNSQCHHLSPHKMLCDEYRIVSTQIWIALLFG